MTTLRTPRNMTVRQALTRLRAAMPTLWTDANTRLGLRTTVRDPKRYGHDLIGWQHTTASCGAGIRIGIVDSEVDTAHPAFAGQRVTVKSMLSTGTRTAPKDHATAIASILAGNPHQPSYAGLIPGAEIYTASVFRLRGKEHVDTTAELVVLALDWLAGQQVSVINFSLGGPRNLILEAALQRIFNQGIIVVGAAGNNGPDSPPDYPGAQDGVIAVTAVDAQMKVYDSANQGDYIAFAAPGVDIWSAKPGGEGTYVTGTSFAVPYVVAAVALERLADPAADAQTIVQRLKQNANDLGKPDRDNVYGWGLVRIRNSCDSGGFR
jgi:subtilisin family serine protease